MKTTVAQKIQKKVDSINIDIKECNDKLTSDYLYNYRWGYADELYKLNRMRKHLTSLIAKLKEDRSEGTLYFIKYLIQLHTSTIMDGGFVGMSTSQASNNAHTFDREVLCKLIEFLKGIMEMIENNEIDC